MSRRPVLRGALAGVALSAVVLTGATAQEAPVDAGATPPDTAIEVTVDGLRDGELIGSYRCDAATTAVFTISVTQRTGAIPVSGWDPDRLSLACGPEARPLAVRLDGDGVLLPGTASYSVRVQTDEGDGAREEGELRVDRPTALDIRPEEGGPLPIAIAGIAKPSKTGLVTWATVTCDTPTTLRVELDGFQRVAMYHLSFFSGADVACDGRTPVRLPFTSFRGQLRPGPATVSVTATPVDDFGRPVEGGSSSTTRQVRLWGATPEPSFSPGSPDPDSSVVIAGVRRDPEEPGQLQVDIDVPGCDAGFEAGVSVRVRPVELRLYGRWFDPALARQSSSTPVPCPSEPGRVVLSVPDTFGNADEVAVSTEFAVLVNNEPWESPENQGVFPITDGS